jgi:hypothetical protein
LVWAITVRHARSNADEGKNARPVSASVDAFDNARHPTLSNPAQERFSLQSIDITDALLTDPNYDGIRVLNVVRLWQEFDALPDKRRSRQSVAIVPVSSHLKQQFARQAVIV